MVFLFVLFFQPFTTEVFDFENKLLFFAGFGLICLISLLVAQILFQKSLIQNDNNIADNSFINTLYYFTITTIISLGFVFYLRYVGGITSTFTLVFRIIIVGAAIAASINIHKLLLSLSYDYQQLLVEDRAIKDKLKKFSENYANRFIQFISENDSDNFRILVSDLVYIKSADNYIEIGYNEGNEVKKRLIRSTLKNAEQQLMEYNNFIRTHRTSIVNIQYLEKLNKNFNTYWLSLINSKESIPVSRQYLIAVRELF